MDLIQLRFIANILIRAKQETHDLARDCEYKQALFQISRYMTDCLLDVGPWPEDENGEAYLIAVYQKEDAITRRLQNL